MNNGKTFLENVAEDMLIKYGTDMSHIAVVFPDKRASLFLNDFMARMAGKPLWAPSYMTISELFHRHSRLTVPNDIKLVCDLHKTYIKVTGTNESLDRFYGYGLRMLADFDDIDKDMADADKVFANVRDIHELDDVSYLSEEQTAMLKIFFCNFTDNHNSELKKRFLNLWSKMSSIYKEYRKCLLEQGIAYEGMMERDVVGKKYAAGISAEHGEEDCTPLHEGQDTYIFVGFNLLRKVERALFKDTSANGKAHFYWDFDHYYMDGNNEAGHYIKQDLECFPNEFDNKSDCYDNLNSVKNITYVSASTEDIQARYASQWLKERGHAAAGRRTAIVLCNEALLPTLTHCISPEAKEVNITMGYPLKISPVCSLVNHLINLQTAGYSKDGGRWHMGNVRRVLAHPYAHYISRNCRPLLQELIRERTYYPTTDKLAVDDALKTLFTPVSGNAEVLRYLLYVIKTIAVNAGNDKTSGKHYHNPLMQEALFKTYTIINTLKQMTDTGELHVETPTLQRLIRHIAETTSIPFNGEPAVGVQIMGVLETRCLDFDNILILSCNEGTMPRNGNEASFIPYSIRKAYGLTTPDNKVAVYAYHFLHMIQRAKDVTICYNSCTTDKHTSEMSRFMMQLMVESPHKIERFSLRAGQRQQHVTPQPMDKDPDIMRTLKSKSYISPSDIIRFMHCQLQFYFNNIAGLKEATTDDIDEMDNRTFGNIFHRAAQLLYNDTDARQKVDMNGGMSTIAVTDELIKNMLSHKERIEATVDRALREELFQIKDMHAAMPKLNGTHIIKRKVLIYYMHRLLELDRPLTPFTIVGSEHDVKGRIDIVTSEGNLSVNIGGRVDRIDIITDALTGTRLLRVIDYKTGRALPKNKVGSVEDIFTASVPRAKLSDYYLQAMLYSIIVSDDRQLNRDSLPVSPAILFIQHAVSNGYDPVLAIGKDKIHDIKLFSDEFRKRLSSVLSLMFDPEIPFSPAADRASCSHCPYVNLCGI